MAGVIRLERLHRFEQVLWRACHGNVFMRHAEINENLEDPTTVSSIGVLHLTDVKSGVLARDCHKILPQCPLKIVLVVTLVWRKFAKPPN